MKTIKNKSSLPIHLNSKGMKKALYLFVFIFFVSSLQTVAQESYDETTNIYWDKDSITFLTPNCQLDPKDFKIRFTPQNSAFVSITVFNNSNTAIDIDWSHTSCYFNDKFNMLKLDSPISYSTKQQIQHLAKNDFASQLLRSSLNDDLIPLKEVKKQYKKTRQNTNIDMELRLKIIYNDEAISLMLFKHGCYKGGK